MITSDTAFVNSRKESAGQLVEAVGVGELDANPVGSGVGVAALGIVTV